MPACRDNVERGLQSGTELEGKDAKTLTRALIEQLNPIRTLLHTATTDNGKEFAGHKDIATALGIDVYFAHPYHSRGRGDNENGVAEPIPPDRNLSRCRNDKSHLDFFASDPEHEVYKPVKTSLKNKKSGAYEIFLGTEIVKDPGLLECKHRGFQIQQMFRSMIELDFGKVEDCKCIIRHLLAGCGQYSKILSPIS